MRHLKIVLQLGLILLLSRLRFTKQYTYWNLVLSVLQRPLGIQPTALFLNSTVIWLGFQYGATDGSKHRLIKKNKIPNVLTFIMLDLAGHLLPMLIWGWVVVRSKKQISLKDWKTQSTWVAAYFVLVVKGLNAYKQYTDYPYWRHVFQSIFAAPVTMYAVNTSMEGNFYPLVCTLSAVWYGKDYFDLVDTRPDRKDVPYFVAENVISQTAIEMGGRLSLNQKENKID